MPVPPPAQTSEPTHRGRIEAHPRYAPQKSESRHGRTVAPATVARLYAPPGKYWFAEGIRFVRVKYFVIGHNGHQFFGVAASANLYLHLILAEKVCTVCTSMQYRQAPKSRSPQSILLFYRYCDRNKIYHLEYQLLILLFTRAIKYRYALFFVKTEPSQ